MKYQIRRVTVIGAGTMGAAIAAHLANAGVPVTLLDIVPRELTPEEEKKGLTLQDREVRNRIVRQGFERALKSKPAAFFTKDHAALVTLGNLEDDLEEAVKHSDWVIEAVVERLDIKRSLMERIDAIRPEHTIVSTNTSGIPIKDIAEGRSEGFRQHFLGTHFFNPPRYLHLLEIIPGPDTLPEVVEFISAFGETRLGKGIVPCKDTPNFIGNRIAFGSGAFVLDYVLEHGYTVEEVDAITGPLMGRPKTATFRLIDLVGVDVWDHVGRNLREAIPHDAMAQKYLASERVNNLIAELVKRGWLGNKTKQGFYKQVKKDGKKEYWHLNLETLEYEPPSKPRFESVGKVKDIEDLGERLKAWVKETDRAAQLVRAILYQGFAYASSVIPEIADTPKPIDDAMRWGFAHQAGPFEIWDMLGVAETVEAMKAEGFPPAPWVEEMLAAGFSTFYEYADGRKVGVYHPGKKAYEPIKRSPKVLFIKEEKAAGKVIEENMGASIVDLGDGVIAVEFHTKMNALDDDIFAMLNRALDLVDEGRYEGIVIGGAGLSGVEIAAEMAYTLRRYKKVLGTHTRDIRITLIDAAETIMPGADPYLIEHTHHRLEELGVEIKLSSFIDRVEEREIYFRDDASLAYDFMIFTGGIKVVGLPESIDAEKNEIGQLIPDNTLRLPGRENVYAIGDCIELHDKKGKLLPPTAQMAEKSAEYVAEHIINRMDRSGTAPFHAEMEGLFVALGGKYATGILFERIKVRGYTAYLLKKAITTIYRWGLELKVNAGYRSRGRK
ncbi:MAG: hypothetical protein DSZ24_06565 [Thermodesulfatator sp.]|nr:MAG: hypothetical protein DSZ24_06565 [Thermodesulfatator sp.]